MLAGSGVDYLVIGAGSSGCVVAVRLSEDDQCTVLLLEAGGWDDRQEIHNVDAASGLALLTSAWSPEIDWGYATVDEPGLGGRSIPIARGKVVGGCSSVNALMWVRGSRFDYDHWSSLGNEGWAFSDVLPYFRRAEDYDGEPGELRGSGGPIGVRRHPNPTAAAEALISGADELGYTSSCDSERDYNGAAQEGFGFYYQSTRTAQDRRCSTATGYLLPARNRANLTVEVGAQVTRLVLRGDRVVGVEYIKDGQACSVAVDREVVLSGGAFETPKLLMLSGIGPAQQLRGHGIECRHDLPGVGRNLQDHLFVPVCYQSRRELSTAAPMSEAGLFTRTGDRIPGTSPNLQFTFGPIKFLAAGAPASQREGPGFTFAPVALQPESSGEVFLTAADPTVPAMVRANYLDSGADMDVLVYGVELARALAATSAFDSLRGAELGPGMSAKGRIDLREYVRANATTLWHPVGTCRMGFGPDAVVDPELRVHGVGRLRIADASIMPRIVAGNTNAACVMIGEKAVDLIKQKPDSQI